MAVVAGVEGKPLRLKDLLELDCDSCSAAGFRCYPRHLCAPAAAPLRARHNALHEAPEAPRGVGRSPSLRHPLLSIRSLSRRLRDGFSWRRREEEEEDAAAPLPAASSGSSSSISDSESSESGSSTERKSESDFSASSTESLHAGVTAAGTACTREEDKEAMDRESKDADDKEQLSPVAVMDFPFDDDDDDDEEDGDPVEEEEEGSACSTSISFSDSLAQLHQRRNIQMHYKIRRRFGSIGEVGAVDLDESFAASDHDGPGSVPAQQPEHFYSDDGAATPSLPDGHRSVDACQDPMKQNLLPLLTDVVSAAGVSERLLLDFFAETRKNGTSENFEAAARMAEGWIQGTGAGWGLKEVLCGRERLLAEMDRSQRWSARVGEGEEEREIGVVVAGLLVDELVVDLLKDLLL